MLNYERDIAPNPLTVLYAGVGSGKNTFVSKLMNGDLDRGIPKKTVLLITSRLAKVRETLGDQDLDISVAIGNCNTLNEIWGIPEDEAEQYSFE